MNFRDMDFFAFSSKGCKTHHFQPKFHHLQPKFHHFQYKNRTCSCIPRHFRRSSALCCEVPVVAVTTSWNDDVTAIFADHWSFSSGGLGSHAISCAFPWPFAPIRHLKCKIHHVSYKTHRFQYKSLPRCWDALRHPVPLMYIPSPQQSPSIHRSIYQAARPLSGSAIRERSINRRHVYTNSWSISPASRCWKSAWERWAPVAWTLRESGRVQCNRHDAPFFAIKSSFC